MFDIDAGKILVVGVVALLVIGPKDLPRVLRTVGQTVGRMRRMASEFQNQFMEAIKEADLEEVKKEISAINEAARIDAPFDPASVMRSEITAAVEGPGAVGQSVIDLTRPSTENELAPPEEAAAPLELAQPPAAAAPLEEAHESAAAPVTVESEVGGEPLAKAMTGEAVGQDERG